MSNTDFDPDAYLAAAPPAAAPPAATPAAAAPAFNPDAYLASPPPAGGFDPDAYLKTPTEPTPHQAYRASVKALAAGSPEQPAGTGVPQPTDFTTERVPPAELAKQWGDVAYGVPKGLAAFPAGGFLGDTESMGRHVVGANPETYFPTTVEGGYLGPKGAGWINPAATPEEAIGMGVGAMLLPGPKMLRAIKGERPPAVPPAMPPALLPERNPLGVTLTEGEATGDLGLRQREQAAFRGADPHAQTFLAQREAQIEAAKQNVAKGLDPVGTVFADNPLDAADVVSQDLAHREDLARAGRQTEAANLQPPALPHPLDAAETVGTSLRNSADTLAATRQTRDVALQTSKEDLRTSLSPTGTVLASTPMEAADIVSGAVGQAAENAQAATTAAYDQLRALPGQFHPASFNKVGDEIVADLNKGANPIRVNPQTTPQAHAAISDLTDILSDVSQERDPVTGQIVKRPPVTPQVVETARQRLNSFYGEALQAARSSNNWSDVRAMRGVMDAFDDAVTTRLTDGRFTGGNAADVAATMRWARGQHAQYRKTFTPQGAGDAVGSAVQQIVGRHEGQAAPPNQIAGMLYGNGPLPVKVAKRLNGVFGADSAEIGAVKQGLFSHITEKPEGVTAWGPSQVADRIYDFLNGRGQALAREYLTPAEQASWKAYADNLRTSVNPPPKPGDTVARVLSQITGEKGAPSTPAEIADTLFGRSNVGENATGVKLAQHIKDTYGEASEPFQAVRNGMAARLLRTTEGRAGWDPEAIANSIDDFLTKRGRPMANTLYTADEQATWQRYADALRNHANTAGTPTTPVGRAIARISGADGRPPALPAEVQNMLWGRAAAQDKEVSVGVAKYLKDLYGETSPKWSAVKQGLFQKMVEPGGNLKNWGPGRVANQISRFLDIDGRDLSNIVFSPQERASIRAYGDLMRKLEMPTGSYFPSAPGIAPLMSTVANRIGQLMGAIIGSHIPFIPRIVGEFAGITIGGKLEKAAERWHNNISKQLPIVADEMQKWQRAQARAAKNPNWATNQGAKVASVGLQKSLAPLGIDFNKLRLSGGNTPSINFNNLQLPGGVAAEPEQQPQQRADGGATSDTPPEGYYDNRMHLTITPPTPDVDSGAFLGKPTGDPLAVPSVDAMGSATKPFNDTLPTPGGANLPLSSGVETPVDTFLARNPSPSPDTPGEAPAAGPAAPRGVVDKLLGLTGPRYQTWPEKMIRSGTTLAGDVLSGAEPDLTGLRREDFTDEPRPGGFTVAAEPQDALIQRTQDMAALAGGASIPNAEEGAFGVLGGKLTQPETPFYSTVENAIANAPQQKMQASQWAGWLKNQPGVKGEELDYLGLNDSSTLPTDAKGLVNKADLLSHVQGNGVGLKEVEKGGSNIDDEAIGEEADRIMKQWQAKEPGIDHVANVGENGLFAAIDDFGNVIGTGNSEAQARATAKNNLKEIRSNDPDTLFELSQEAADNNLRLLSSATKFSDYQLPGGENYREMLLTMPNKKPALTGDEQGFLAYAREQRGRDRQLSPAESAYEEQLIQKQRAQLHQDDTSFRSSHWDEPNVLAHMRMNDRDIPGVGKSLHLEEAQSDWGQLGRKNGFKSDHDAATQRTIDAEKKWIVADQRYRAEPTEANNQAYKAAAKDYENANQRQMEVQAGGAPAPDMPFAKTWPDLLLKRAITKAAREGKDAISWTPGEQQAARYDLSKQVKELRWNKTDSMLTAIDHNGNTVMADRVPQDKLADHIGKDAAEKLINHPTQVSPNKELNYLSGADLKVGGTGMKSFYDKMLVDKANAIGKKYGAKVEWKDLPDAGEKKFGPPDLSPEETAYEERNGPKLPRDSLKVPVLRLTPQLKEQALTKGMPLFSDTAKPGAALSGLERRQSVVSGLGRDPVVKHTAQDWSTIRSQMKDLKDNDNLTPQQKIQQARDLQRWAQSRANDKAFAPFVYQATKQAQDIIDQNKPRLVKRRGGAITAKSDKQKVPRPIAQEPHSGQPAQEQNRAHGGRVNPANINHAPSDAQKHAGNYAKDKIHIHGLEVAIENAKGKHREGIGKDGKVWRVKMPASYGYILGTVGKDKDHLDVFVGPHPKSNHVYLIDQVRDDTKHFDEHKILMGFGSQAQALNYYKRAFSDGRGQARIGAIHSMTVGELKTWLTHGDTKTPFKPPQVKKLSHAEVGYEPKAKNMDNRCFNCVHFVPARHGGPECLVVTSPISPQGWCPRFRRKRL